MLTCNLITLQYHTQVPLIYPDMQFLKYVIDLRKLTWVDFKIFKIRILTQYKYKQMYVKNIQNKFSRNKFVKIMDENVLRVYKCI